MESRFIYEAYMFQLTAARRRLEAGGALRPVPAQGFQLTAARRRLVASMAESLGVSPVSTHSRPEAAGPGTPCRSGKIPVSTHSRPEAAGWSRLFRRRLANSFNSQPPGGGWRIRCHNPWTVICFNSQPPGGGWFVQASLVEYTTSFNSQPPGGGWSALSASFSHPC